MCRNLKWAILLGSITGLIQSVAWIAMTLSAALVYLGVIPVEQYESEKDFLRVTLVKLYFEGPTCNLKGDYLGKFNEDYKNRKVIQLLLPDIVFALVIGYFVLNLLHLVVSALLFSNRNAESGPERKRLHDISFGWSAITLIQCAMDGALMAFLTMDFVHLMDYMVNFEDPSLNPKTPIKKIPMIPFILALASGRLILFWIWNATLGGILFVGSLCCKPSGREPKTKAKVVVETPKVAPKPPRKDPPKEDPAPVSLVNGNYSSSFDVVSNPSFIDFKRSMEAVTRFNEPAERKSQYSGYSRRSYYDPSESLWQGPSHRDKSHQSDRWEMDNEGFVGDDGMSVSEKAQDFDHNLKNFEQGQRKPRTPKPPLGKPVSIPVPPPLPSRGSCNC